jgi:hypothetical protein
VAGRKDKGKKTNRKNGGRNEEYHEEGTKERKIIGRMKEGIKSGRKKG